MSDRKLLIVSNNCLSQHNSNGRTLLNLLSGFKRENLYQIYTSGEYTDEKYCAASYRVTNQDVLKAYLGKSPANQQVLEESHQVDVKKKNLSNRKNALTMLLRDLAWDWNWKLMDYIVAWSEDKHPEAIVLQLGDSTHLIRIAVKLSRKLNIPLITYNTEDYYFKDYDFMKQSLKAGVIYRVFHHRFCRKFKNMMSYSPTCLYNCEGLRLAYDKEFGTKSHVIFGGTNMNKVDTINENGKILYAGNLGVGRHIPLIEIGHILNEEGLYIDVYGNASDEIKHQFEMEKGIHYHGFVSYEENCKNIVDSRLLIHVEGFNEYYSKDTRFAFSTKIADYCASGIPIFMYAPEWCESTKYSKEYDLAFIASDQESLREILHSALYNSGMRSVKSLNAQKIAFRNHQIDNNKQLTEKIIEEACSTY